MTFSFRILTVMAALISVSASVQAQSAPSTASAPSTSSAAPLRVRGVITRVNTHALTIKEADGKSTVIALPANVTIRSVSRASLEAIKPDSFIGTAATERPDGTLKALEVHIFAASLRGSGEGFRPWQGAGGVQGTMTNGAVGSMTNGTVGAMTNGTVSSASGARRGGSDSKTLVVNYKGGQQTVLVTPDVPVVYMAPGKFSQIKPGAPVLVSVTVKPPSTDLTALSVIVGRNGVVPPM